MIDGTTYTFRPIQSGPDDDFFSFCTVVAGSLQASMQLVDAAGQRLEGVDGGELDFILLEPGGLYESTGDPAELNFTLPDPALNRYFQATVIDAPMSGRHATGTFTAADFRADTEVVTGTIDASC